VRAQIVSQLFLLASTPDGDSMEIHVPATGHQDVQVRNALHRDRSRPRNGVAKSVVGGDTRAEERGGFGGMSSSGMEAMARASAIITSAILHPTVTPVQTGSDNSQCLRVARLAHPVFAAIKPTPTR